MLACLPCSVGKHQQVPTRPLCCPRIRDYGKGSLPERMDEPCMARRCDLRPDEANPLRLSLLSQGGPDSEKRDHCTRNRSGNGPAIVSIETVASYQWSFDGAKLPRRKDRQIEPPEGAERPPKIRCPKGRTWHASSRISGVCNRCSLASIGLGRNSEIRRVGSKSKPEG